MMQITDCVSVIVRFTAVITVKDILCIPKKERRSLGKVPFWLTSFLKRHRIFWIDWRPTIEIMPRTGVFEGES